MRRGAGNSATLERIGSCKTKRPYVANGPVTMNCYQVSLRVNMMTFLLILKRGKKKSVNGGSL